MRESTLHQSQPLWAIILVDLLYCGKPSVGLSLVKTFIMTVVHQWERFDPSGCWLGFGERCREDPQCGCMSKRDVSLALPSLTGPCISQEGGEYKRIQLRVFVRSMAEYMKNSHWILLSRCVSDICKIRCHNRAKTVILTRNIDNNENSIREHIMKILVFHFSNMRTKDKDFRRPE